MVLCCDTAKSDLAVPTSSRRVSGTASVRFAVLSPCERRPRGDHAHHPFESGTHKALHDRPESQQTRASTAQTAAPKTTIENPINLGARL